MQHLFEVYPITLWSMSKRSKIVWDENKQLWICYTQNRRVDAARDIWMLCRKIARIKCDYMSIPPRTPYIVFPKETDISSTFEHLFLRQTLTLVGNTELPYRKEIRKNMEDVIFQKYSLETLERLGVNVNRACGTCYISYAYDHCFGHVLFSYGTSEYPDKY